MLLHFKTWCYRVHCFHSDQVSPEFSPLHLCPVPGPPAMVAAALHLQHGSGESFRRLDLQRSHDSARCLWEPCSLSWNLCCRFQCSCYGLTQSVPCMVRRDSFPYPDLPGALLFSCSSHHVFEAQTWEGDLHKKHQHCVCLASLHFKNSLD